MMTPGYATVANVMSARVDVMMYVGPAGLEPTTAAV
jgi:hypothetical protein